MRALVAVVCAHSRPEFVKVLRETWVPIFSVQDCDLRLVFGRGTQREPLSDEIFLECDDSYQGLPEKVREIVRWALKNGYDRVLKCDDDVVIRPDRFHGVIHASGHFIGAQASLVGPPGRQVAVPYGFCYWLTQTAMEIVALAELPPPGDNNDELWVARELYKRSIYLQNDSRYSLIRGPKPRHPDDCRALRSVRRVKMEDSFPEGNVAWCIHSWLRQLTSEEKCSTFRKVFADQVGAQNKQN